MNYIYSIYSIYVYIYMYTYYSMHIYIYTTYILTYILTYDILFINLILIPFLCDFQKHNLKNLKSYFLKVNFDLKETFLSNT